MGGGGGSRGQQTNHMPRGHPNKKREKKGWARLLRQRVVQMFRQRSSTWTVMGSSVKRMYSNEERGRDARAVTGAGWRRWAMSARWTAPDCVGQMWKA